MIKDFESERLNLKNEIKRKDEQIKTLIESRNQERLDELENEETSQK